MLVTRVAVLGDKRAFDVLVLRYQSPLRRFFLNLTLGDAVLSDDLSQDTFIKAYTHIASFRGSARFSTWLLRIGYNVYYDHLRKEKEKEHVPLDHILWKSDGKNGANTDKNMDIYTALRELKEEERTAVLLYYMEDMKQEQIARVMDCPPGTVKTYLHRAKEKMGTFLKKDNYGNE